MADTKPSSSGPVNPRAVFATTHWSVVLSAARHDTARAQAALARLCQTIGIRFTPTCGGAVIRRRTHRI